MNKTRTPQGQPNEETGKALIREKYMPNDRTALGVWEVRLAVQKIKKRFVGLYAADNMRDVIGDMLLDFGDEDTFVESITYLGPLTKTITETPIWWTTRGAKPVSSSE